MELALRARQERFSICSFTPVDADLVQGIGGGNSAPIDEFRRSCPGMHDVTEIRTDDVVGADLRRILVATDDQRS